MTQLIWDADGARQYETGTDHGVLFKKDNTGAYGAGVAWNGLISVTESPSGAEKSAIYAGNKKYGSMMSAEEFAATIEAYTYPDEFAECDGSVEIAPGVLAGQQNRVGFGFSYRTKIGTDANPDAGYKLHLVYGAMAAPSEKAYTTVNESPEAITFSWEIDTTPVTVADLDKPTAIIIINSLTADATKLAALEAILYGVTLPTPIVSRFPTISEIITLMGPLVP